MGQYDNLKKLVLPRNIIKNTITTSLNPRGQITTAGPGNEGVELGDWIQERIEDGTIVVTPPISATNLSFSRDTVSVTVISDTGTDASLPASTTSLAGVMTAGDKINLNSLISLSGVPQNSTNLGTFSGNIIPDNVNIKVALQALETSLGSLPSLNIGNLTSPNTAITVTGGTGAVVNGGTSITFNPANVSLISLSGVLNLSQLSGLGANNGDFLTFNGTNWVSTNYTPPISDHNDLTGIQGGITDEYYHLTQSLYEQLTNASANKLIGRVSTAGVVQELTLGGSLVFNSTAIQLSNDNLTPGNTMYYGTNGSGIKGWYSAVFSGVTSLSVTDSAEIDFTITNPTTTPNITGVLKTTTVTPGTYGSGSNIPTFVVDNKGRLTGAGSIPISISSSAITDLSETIDDRVFGLLIAGTNISFVYDDPANTLTINSTASINGTGTANQIAYWLDSDTLTGDNDFKFDGTYLTLGTSTPSNLSRFTSKGLGNSLSTFGYIHQSSVGTDVFKLADNGAILIGGFGEVYIHPDQINITKGGTYAISKSGGDLQLDSDTTIKVTGGSQASNTPSFISLADRSTNIGALYNAQIIGTVGLSLGGSNPYTDLLVETHIDQGLHTGIIRGVHIKPVITTVTNYRALDIEAPAAQTALRVTSGKIKFDFTSNATGDLFYRDSTGYLQRLPLGASSDVLTSDGTTPVWAASSSSLPMGVSGDVLIYSGSAWIAASPQVETQTGITGVTITLASTPLSAPSLILYRNGIYQIFSDNYTMSGTTITMVDALSSTDKITAIYYTT